MWVPLYPENSYPNRFGAQDPKYGPERSHVHPVRKLAALECVRAPHAAISVCRVLDEADVKQMKGPEGQYATTHCR